MSFNSKYSGPQVEDLLDRVANGNAGGGGSITEETDPIFSASPAAKITDTNISEWNNKVDKVEGKQLSTEDFTTLLKQKLEGLSNYDDTTINNALSSLQTQINTIVSGNASTAIESFNEIIAFLNGVTDSQSLDSIIASIEQQIAAKYTKPTTGIPKSDLNSAVQTSLGKADTALQSIPAKYITASMLADGVAVSGPKGDTGATGPQGEQGPQGIQGVQGNNGITFTPSVDTEGNLSWSNNGALPNPSTVNIRGPKGTDDVVFIKVDDIFSEEPIRITLEDYENMLNKNVVILEPGSFWFEESRSDINSDSFSIFLNTNRGGQIQVVDFLVQKNESYAEILQGEYWKGYDLESIKSNYWQDEWGTEGGEYGILPNIFHKWDEVASLSITLDADDGEEGIVDEYIFQFTSGATPTVLSLPADIQWYKDEAPTIEANMVYQISIINNLGVWGAFPSAS